MKPRVTSPRTSRAPESKKSQDSYDEASTARPAKRKGQEPVGEAAETNRMNVKRDIRDRPRSETPAISEQEISERARAIWEHEGKPEGRDEDIWFRAEAELKTERS